MAKYHYFVSFNVNDYSMGITLNPTRIHNTEVTLSEPITKLSHVRGLEEVILPGHPEYRRHKGDDYKAFRIINFQLLRTEHETQPE